MACFLELLAFSLLNCNSFRTETEISLRKQVASRDKALLASERRNVFIFIYCDLGL